MLRRANSNWCDGKYFQFADEPVVQFAVRNEFEGADAVRDLLDGITLAVGEVVHGVNAPIVARAVVVGVLDAVHDRVAHVHVGVRHVDPGPQHFLTVAVLAVLHLPEQPQVLFDARLRKGLSVPGWVGVPFWAAICSAVLSSTYALPLRMSFDGVFVELIEVVGGVEFVLPGEAQPPHVVLDALHVLSVFGYGVGVVEAQIGVPAVLPGEPEVEADAFGVTDVQVAVGLRWESGHDAFIFSRFPGRRPRSLRES
jgi:hypothetical protein